MKRKHLLFIVLGVVLLSFSSCKKDDSDDNKLTETQKTEIKSSYAEIESVADLFVKGEMSMSNLQNQIAQFESLPMVEKVWVKDSTLLVKFKNGGTLAWTNKQSLIVPPYGGKKSMQAINSSRIPVGNKKACLINQQFGDESRQYCRDIINQLNTEFTDADFEVTVVNGGSADIDFFQNSINQYGAIFFISHGYYDGTRTWIMTGEEPETPDEMFDKLFSDLYLWWNSGEISVASCKETRNGSKKSVPFYCYSDKFVSNQSGNFPSSLLYLVACQSFKSTTQLAKAYNDKGVAVTIGWDETNCLGQATGKLLFDLLLAGATVGDAFSTLPVDSKIDKCAVPAGANLIYYPVTGKDVFLVDTSIFQINISEPIYGQVYNNRILDLVGYVSGASSITKGIVEVNSIATTLTYSGLSFNQPIVINTGANVIKVTCWVTMPDGKSSYKTESITVNGDFPQLELFTELRWNTNYSDVDFHLLPPGSDFSQLWTSNDCYYDNMYTSWGAYLDVDDIEGYGPEHISIPSNALPGVYHLYIHFFDEDGAGTTNAFVTVGVLNNPLKQFGPYALSIDGEDGQGDVYEVCTIEYPSGTITPVNKYYNLGKFKNSSSANKKNYKPKPVFK